MNERAMHGPDALSPDERSALLDAWPAAAPPPGFAEACLRATAHRPRARARALWWIGAAAALAITLAPLWLTAHAQPPPAATWDLGMP
jgi:hypothetical protein